MSFCSTVGDAARRAGQRLSSASKLSWRFLVSGFIGLITLLVTRPKLLLGVTVAFWFLGATLEDVRRSWGKIVILPFDTIGNDESGKYTGNQISTEIAQQIDLLRDVYPDEQNLTGGRTSNDETGFITGNSFDAVDSILGTLVRGHVLRTSEMQQASILQDLDLGIVKIPVSQIFIETVPRLFDSIFAETISGTLHHWGNELELRINIRKDGSEKKIVIKRRDNENESRPPQAASQIEGGGQEKSAPHNFSGEDTGWVGLQRDAVIAIAEKSNWLPARTGSSGQTMTPAVRSALTRGIEAYKRFKADGSSEDIKQAVMEFVDAAKHEQPVQKAKVKDKTVSPNEDKNNAKEDKHSSETEQQTPPGDGVADPAPLEHPLINLLLGVALYESLDKERVQEVIDDQSEASIRYNRVFRSDVVKCADTTKANTPEVAPASPARPPPTLVVQVTIAVPAASTGSHESSAMASPAPVATDESKGIIWNYPVVACAARKQFERVLENSIYQTEAKIGFVAATTEQMTRSSIPCDDSAELWKTHNTYWTDPAVKALDIARRDFGHKPENMDSVRKLILYANLLEKIAEAKELTSRCTLADTSSLGNTVSSLYKSLDAFRTALDVVKVQGSFRNRNEAAASSPGQSDSTTSVRLGTRAYVRHVAATSEVDGDDAQFYLRRKSKYVHDDLAKYFLADISKGGQVSSSEFRSNRDATVDLDYSIDEGEKLLELRNHFKPEGLKSQTGVFLEGTLAENYEWRATLDTSVDQRNKDLAMARSHLVNMSAVAEASDVVKLSNELPSAKTLPLPDVVHWARPKLAELDFYLGDVDQALEDVGLAPSEVFDGDADDEKQRTFREERVAMPNNEFLFFVDFHMTLEKIRKNPHKESSPSAAQQKYVDIDCDVLEKMLEKTLPTSSNVISITNGEQPVEFSFEDDPFANIGANIAEQEIFLNFHKFGVLCKHSMPSQLEAYSRRALDVILQEIRRAPTSEGSIAPDAAVVAVILESWGHLQDVYNIVAFHSGSPKACEKFGKWLNGFARDGEWRDKVGCPKSDHEPKEQKESWK